MSATVSVLPRATKMSTSTLSTTTVSHKIDTNTTTAAAPRNSSPTVFIPSGSPLLSPSASLGSTTTPSAASTTTTTTAAATTTTSPSNSSTSSSSQVSPTANSGGNNSSNHNAHLSSVSAWSDLKRSTARWMLGSSMSPSNSSSSSYDENSLPADIYEESAKASADYKTRVQSFKVTPAQVRSLVQSKQAWEALQDQMRQDKAVTNAYLKMTLPLRLKQILVEQEDAANALAQKLQQLNEQFTTPASQRSTPPPAVVLSSSNSNAP